jgi:mevalonate kinase
MEYPFYKKLSGTVIPAVEEAIHAKLSGQEDTFTNAIQRISSFQFENLQPMIPETLRPFWQTGLDTNQYYVKLCGSGGGGYFLLFTDNKDLLPNLPKEMELVEL